MVGLVTRAEIIAARRAGNETRLRDRGPGLYHDTETWVEARCRVHGVVLVAGIGSMGTGRAWMRDRTDRGDAADSTYASAPDVCAQGCPAVLLDGTDLLDDFGTACDGTRPLDDEPFIAAMLRERETLIRLGVIREGDLRPGAQ